MDCFLFFIGLLTFLGEVLMDFTTRKLVTLVKPMSNKNTVEERSRLRCPASCERPSSPRRRLRAPKPRGGGGSGSPGSSRGIRAGV